MRLIGDGVKWDKLPEKHRKEFLAKGIKKTYLEISVFYKTENGQCVGVL